MKTEHVKTLGTVSDKRSKQAFSCRAMEAREMKMFQEKKSSQKALTAKKWTCVKEIHQCTVYSGEGWGPCQANSGSLTFHYSAF